jgi:hypothetical protein
VRMNADKTNPSSLFSMAFICGVLCCGLFPDCAPARAQVR